MSATTNAPIRFTRKDLSDGAEETLTLVILPDGSTLWCEFLDKQTPYAVVVDDSDDGTGDAGLYDLDGDAIPHHVATIRACDIAYSAPDYVIEALEDWATGLKTVERVL